MAYPSVTMCPRYSPSQALARLRQASDNLTELYSDDLERMEDVVLRFKHTFGQQTR